MLSPSFTASKLKGMFNLINQCALDLKEFLLKGHKESEAVDMKDLFTRYTNDVIASAAFGMTVNSLKERENEFYKLGRKATNFDTVRTMKFFVIQSFPWLARLLRIRIIDTNISDFFINIISKNVESRLAQGITRPDMIQLMLQANNDSKSGMKMDMVDMTAQAFIFFFAGFETTATAMCFVAHHLAAYPEVVFEKYKIIPKEILSSGILTNKSIVHFNRCRKD